MNEERERPEFLRRVDAIAPWVLDGALALVVLLPTLAISAHGLHHGVTGARAVEVLSATVFSTLPLLVRRRWPVQVLIAILIVAVAVPSAAVFSPPALVAIYTIASRRPWRVAVWSAIAAAVALDLHRLLWGYSLPLLGVIAGLPCRVRRWRSASTKRLASRTSSSSASGQTAGARARPARRAGRDAERLRIARELHDVVAHDVSLMVIQAQALHETTATTRRRAAGRRQSPSSAATR